MNVTIHINLGMENNPQARLNEFWNDLHKFLDDFVAYDFLQFSPSNIQAKIRQQDGQYNGNPERTAVIELTFDVHGSYDITVIREAVERMIQRMLRVHEQECIPWICFTNPNINFRFGDRAACLQYHELFKGEQMKFDLSYFHFYKD